MIEFHHQYEKTKFPLDQHKIILGSFPVWSLTISEDQKINLEKESTRRSSGEIPFYYGSKKNKFWFWYQAHVDAKIDPRNPTSILNSLSNNKIGITDIILSCERKEKSAYDKHLTNRTYNHDFLKMPVKNEKIKILCTSKGVMNEMLLAKVLLGKHKNLQINTGKSNNFQKQIVEKLDGEFSQITSPFYQYIEIENGGTIECFSLPSPGSPFRKLDTFGFSSNTTSYFLSRYLELAFEWFQKG